MFSPKDWIVEQNRILKKLEGFYFIYSPFGISDNYRKNTIISMERTICFGNCPQYKIILKGDGSCKLLKMNFIDTVDCINYSVPITTVDSILIKMFETNFFDLNEYYCPYVEDIPYTITSIITQSGSKTVVRGCQVKNKTEELVDFENYIDKKLLIDVYY